MISFILPTRDRPEELTLTLAALARLDAAALALAGGAEVIVADNASRHPPALPDRLSNGIGARVLLRPANEAAAARNAAARLARGGWLLMLDDDSAPLDAGFIEALRDAPSDVAVIGAEILLPDGTHERGGLPEVFIGCGAAIRRDAFLDAGGYDASFGYYAEEYDLSAKFLLAGMRIVHDRRFRVVHRKVAAGRSMDVILARLVRNNGWVEQRYAPDFARDEALTRTVGRYRLIAERERATRGFEEGLAELRATLAGQPRREMPMDLYERFTGLAAARAHLEPALERLRPSSVALVAEGKNAWAVRRAVEECGTPVARRAKDAAARVIGTLSPGPVTDAAGGGGATGGVPTLTPWWWDGAGQAVALGHEPAAARH